MILLNIKKLLTGILTLIILSICVYLYVNNKPSVNNIKDVEIGTKTNNNIFKIVAFGDSLTAGLGVDLKDSYPSILENILNSNPEYKKYDFTFNVINMGVSGETSSGGLDRVDFVLEQKPDLILMGLGSNDMLRNTSPTLVKFNMDTIVQNITSSKVPLILIGMQSVASNGKEYKNDFDAIYPNVANKYSIPLVPFFLEGVALEPDLNNADGIHPNRSGYEKIINENILPVLDVTLRKLIDGVY